MVMELDEDLDIREIRPGEHEAVCVFRDNETGESLRLNLEQVNRVLSGDLNEVHDAALTKESLLMGRNVLASLPGVTNG